MKISDYFEVGTPAAILSWGQLDTPLAKTAHGLLRHSKVFKPVCVVDKLSGTVGKYVSHVRYDVPIVKNIVEALKCGAKVLLVGVAPVGGTLPKEMVNLILDAIKSGMDVVSGLHVKLSETEPFKSVAKACGIRIIDVRKYTGELKIFSGKIYGSKVIRVACLGTDCASGKRTTCVQLWQRALERKIPAGFLATGQTGIMIGADEGAPLDAIPADFIPGVVEDLILKLESEGKKVVFIEGQGALRHPAYGQVTLGLVYGCMPQFAIVAHDPSRNCFEFFPQIPLKPDVGAEIDLLKKFVDVDILGISCLDDSYSHDGLFVFNPFDDKALDCILDKLEVVL
ncbi:DUF1611 domain-containing protein [Pseudothermotoga thermarum]|uniref:DUF1611 domain-containing protein n=1 Tax=Pseudothermotoga thermarum DSM 5069 TaxID=688269 RepID=F7YYF9_9THEM|nr:DUF1611 domain-containing protein [Pseudothermotoga thermarum]AEH50983.1 protein of unknown function DUF1611 [Pseudothermotoga thermarum DSM 5069]